jgi:hypothetical protein
MTPASGIASKVLGTARLRLGPGPDRRTIHAYRPHDRDMEKYDRTNEALFTSANLSRPASSSLLTGRTLSR